MNARSPLPAILERAGDTENAFRDLHHEIGRVFDEFSRGTFSSPRRGESGSSKPPEAASKRQKFEIKSGA